MSNTPDVNDPDVDDPDVDNLDVNDLAKRYMDLWQEHLNAVAGDKNTAEVMARTMAVMSSGAQAFAAGAGHDFSGNPPRPEAAAASDGHPVAERAQLLGRLAALEGRVAQLESELAILRERTRPIDPPDDP